MRAWLLDLFPLRFSVGFDGLDALDGHLVDQGCPGRNEVEEGCCEGEKHGDREGHLSHVPEEVDRKPSLESECQKR